MPLRIGACGGNLHPGHDGRTGGGHGEDRHPRGRGGGTGVHAARRAFFADEPTATACGFGHAGTAGARSTGRRAAAGAGRAGGPAS